MADSLVDANVVIAVLRGDDRVSRLLEELDCGVDTTVYVELIQGAKSKREVAIIERVLSTFPILHFNEAISRRTIALIRNYSKSHGLLLADAVIAATCLEFDVDLLTFNIKDFRFIKGLRVQAPEL